MAVPTLLGTSGISAAAADWVCEEPLLHDVTAVTTNGTEGTDTREGCV